MVLKSWTRIDSPLNGRVGAGVRRALSGGFVQVGMLRVVAMLVGGVVTTIATWLVSKKFGLSGYGLFALMSTFLIFLPFADLGLGATLTNLAADYKNKKTDLATFMRSASYIRAILWAVGLVVCGISVIVGLVPGWSFLLGNEIQSPMANVAVSAVFCAVGISVPLGSGARLLQGAGRMDVVAKIAIVNPLVQIALLLPLLRLVQDPALLGLVPAFAFLVVSFFTDRAGRRFSQHTVLPFLPQIVRHVRLQRMWSSSIAFMIVSLGMIGIFQVQRVLLARVGDATQLAEFSLIAQYLIPVLSVLVIMSQLLWSRYRGDVSRQTFIRDLVRFLGFSVLGGIALIAVSIAVAEAGSGSGLKVTWPSLALASCYLCLMGVFQPCSMLLTDNSGLKVQAFCTVFASAISVSTSIYIAPQWGVAGALTAVCLGVFFGQVAPLLPISLRRLSPRRTQVESDQARI